ncbi:MFS transporter [Catellatospora paridis]|uniref:MFS transporter n=1 Tax=Catellatospora paridis TaxID=1617086 RepID=UPI0012D3DA69|nr:MFS transporter [Catellatospora paridis]
MENISNGRRWLGLMAILAATLMNLLDSTVVNVAAPSILADLHGTYGDLQWIAAGYTLALAVGLLVGGRLGDMFGRRRVLLIGVVGFVAASALCAAAWSPESLIGSRVVQGLFGAVMIPQGFGLIRDLFGPADIGKAFGVFGPAIGLSTILGPVVSGVLVDADLFGTGWRMVFAINLPLGLFALIAGLRTLPAGISPARARRLDTIGALLAAAGMFLLVFPLMQGREHGWPAWTWAMLAASVVLLGVFAAYQRRRQASGRTPLVELSVFAKRSYTSGTLFVLVFFGGLVGFSLAVGLFLQLGLHYSPVRASVTMAAWAVGAFLGSGFSAGAMAKLGRRILHLGLALMTVGLVLLYAMFSAYGTGIGGWSLALPLFAYGLGMGMIFVPLFDVIMGDIADHEVGSASGILESIQQLGSSLGVAALGTVFFTAAGVTGQAAGFLHASQRVTLVTIALTAVAFGLAFLLPRKVRGHAGPQQEPAPAAVTPEPEPALV